jgi:hypothetical protein
MSASFDDMYGSKWLKASDLEPKVVVPVYVIKVETKHFEGEARPKLVLHLSDGFKPIALNMTNANTMAEAFGKDPAYWLVRIGIYRTKTEMNGKMVDCVRISILDDVSPDDEADMVNPAAPAKGVAPGRKGMPAAAGLVAMSDDKPWEKK